MLFGPYFSGVRYWTTRESKGVQGEFDQYVALALMVQSSLPHCAAEVGGTILMDSVGATAGASKILNLDALTRRHTSLQIQGFGSRGFGRTQLLRILLARQDNRKKSLGNIPGSMDTCRFCWPC